MPITFRINIRWGIFYFVRGIGSVRRKEVSAGISAAEADAFRGRCLSLLVSCAPAGSSANAIPAGVAALSLQSNELAD